MSINIKANIKLNGTFICADHCNNWTDERFDNELRNMSELGMEYIVLMSLSLKFKTGEFNVSYPSELIWQKNYHNGTDVIEQILKYASKYGIKVFIGLNLHDDWWEKLWEYDVLQDGKDWLFYQMERGNQMADEIYANYHEKYSDSFYGWYWMWECWNFPLMALNSPFRHQSIKILADCLNINLDHITKMNSSMPMLLSPFVNQNLTTSEDLKHQWADIFKYTHFRNGDIFCPQDSCGAAGQHLHSLDEWQRAYKYAVDSKPGLHLWTNNECFDENDKGPRQLEHYVKQLEMNDQYVEKHLSFSFVHHYSKYSTMPGWQKSYEFYLENGYVDFDIPKQISNLKVDYNEAEHKAVITWTHPDPDSIAGCRVYRNKEFIERTARKRDKDISREIPELEMKIEDTKAFPNEKGELEYKVNAFTYSGGNSTAVSLKVK